MPMPKLGATPDGSGHGIGASVSISRPASPAYGVSRQQRVEVKRRLLRVGCCDARRTPPGMVSFEHRRPGHPVDFGIHIPVLTWISLRCVRLLMCAAAPTVGQRPTRERPARSCGPSHALQHELQHQLSRRWIYAQACPSSKCVPLESATSALLIRPGLDEGVSAPRHGTPATVRSPSVRLCALAGGRA